MKCILCLRTDSGLAPDHACLFGPYSSVKANLLKIDMCNGKRVTLKFMHAKTKEDRVKLKLKPATKAKAKAAVKKDKTKKKTKRSVKHDKENAGLPANILDVDESAQPACAAPQGSQQEETKESAPLACAAPKSTRGYFRLKIVRALPLLLLLSSFCKSVSTALALFPSSFI